MPTPPALHLSSLLQHASSVQHIQQAIEEQVRTRPQDADPRWLLASWACIQQDWTRALKQAQMAAKLQTAYVPKAHMLRALIQAEHQREDVFAGRSEGHRAGQVLPWRPWVHQLAQALQLQAQGDLAQADALRMQALDAADDWKGEVLGDGSGKSGETAQAKVQWLADSDSRLGPVCEVVFSGSYRWLPLADIASLHIQPPASLLEHLWLPARITLQPNAVTDQVLHAFIPVRYPGTKAYAEMQGLPQEESLALLLARKTLWQQVGETAVCGIGQKVWMSDQEEWPLFATTKLDVGSH